MNSPLVSIIMPVFNAGLYLESAITSIINQTYANWELLICDDASTDNSYKLLLEIAGTENKRLRIFRNESNLKLLQTRNRLVEEARGELITFQDADDYSDPVRIEKMVREFQSNSRLGLLSSQVAFINADGNLLGTSKKPTDYKTTLDLIHQRNVLGGSMMMIKRSVLDSVGGKFRPYFDGLSYQDYDLSLLIIERSEGYSLPDVLYYYRQHGLSSSKIVSVDRSLAKDVVRHLAKQRKERGCDDLMEGRHEKVDQYFEALRMPYHQDPSLIFREYAANFMYNELYRRAIRTAWGAVKRRPFKFINWATLRYCLKKSIWVKLFQK